MKRKFSFRFAESRSMIRDSVRTKIKSRNFWFNFFRVALILLAIGVVVVLVLFIWYAKDLPSPAKVVRRDGYSSKVYDRNSNALYDIYSDAKREPVAFSDVPDYLKKATVAVEDKSFIVTVVLIC